MTPLSMERNLAVAEPGGFNRAQKSVRSVAVPSCPTFPTFFLSHTTSLLSLDMRIFKDVTLDAPVPRMIASACFRSALQDIPTPSCQQSFLFSIFTSVNIPHSSPSVGMLISSLDSDSFRIQTRSTGCPDTTKSSLCTRLFKLLWG